MKRVSRRITIKDVAAQAGVSTALVSMVLNSSIDDDGKPDCNVRKETAARILEAVGKLGYIPNAAAASIRTGKTRTIAVITSDISSPLFSEICRLIENFFYDRGYNVIFASSDESAAKLSNIIKSATSRNVDGMIILPPPHAKSVLNSLSRFNIPVVLIGRDVPSFRKAGRVLIDNRMSVGMEFNELYDAGHRNIHVIASDMEISSITEKVDAYMALMEEKGLGEGISVHYISPSDGDETVMSTISEALHEGAEAFMLLSNDTTMRFISAINRMGLHVPEDVAFIGFDKSMIYDFMPSTVSHIVESQEELAAKASVMLLGMMEDHETPSTVIISPRLVHGESSACSRLRKQESVRSVQNHLE